MIIRSNTIAELKVDGGSTNDLYNMLRRKYYKYRSDKMKGLYDNQVDLPNIQVHFNNKNGIKVDLQNDQAHFSSNQVHLINSKAKLHRNTIIKFTLPLKKCFLDSDIINCNSSPWADSNKTNKIDLIKVLR
jgi:hypothetical protein